MTTQNSVLTVTDDLPIAVARPVHSGKVRSVYFLSAQDSRRLIEERAYHVPEHSPLALMVISDRLSAYDCAWRSETLAGVPGKGVALNAIAAHWFTLLRDTVGLGNHLLEMPHPMVWVVRQARPVMVEAIARRYITGSLWRAYEKGDRHFAGVALPDGLARYGELPDVLFTPSTKGVMTGLAGVPAFDDAPVDPTRIAQHFEAFGLGDASDLAQLESALRDGFKAIGQALETTGRLLVDTKFEFGFAPTAQGEELIYMDEIGTPDSSRIWRKDDWNSGSPTEFSKEVFREALQDWVPDRDLLLNSDRMEERLAFAKAHRVPDEFFHKVSQVYRDEAEALLNLPIVFPDSPREEILQILSSEFGLLI
ncbi:MAG: phosphoribosylaminoimidazolesuccinocarboxamide synthase [Pseudomonadota bacterium]